MLTPYTARHLETLARLEEELERLEADALSGLREMLAPYLKYRKRTADFFTENLLGDCRRICFAQKRSGCCGRDGIIVFFADFVAELLTSGPDSARRLSAALGGDRGGMNCVYLGPEGCAWSLKPIACEMFLCDEVKEILREKDADLAAAWDHLRGREREFTKPDRPVLFDDLERFFIERGVRDSLMYFHHSPGLLRLKRRHGIGRVEPIEIP